MNDQQKLKETLSALLDDEAGRVDQLELRRLVRALEDHPELLATYQRYTLVRATLKGATTHKSSADFLRGVSAALEREEMADAQPALATAAASYRWLKPAGRVAIAASVAILTVVLVQGLVPVAPAPVSTAITSIATGSTSTGVTAEQSRRLLNPSVLTVSAGDSSPMLQDPATQPALPTGCVLDVIRADDNNLLWQKPLPEGYVLCKQNDSASACESVSANIGCYLEY